MVTTNKCFINERCCHTLYTRCLSVCRFDEDVIMILHGELAELMAKVELQLYWQYIVTTVRGESILYVNMQKVVYCPLKEHCHCILFETEKRSGRIWNNFIEYDPCVANKVVTNGTQMP